MIMYNRNFTMVAGHADFTNLHRSTCMLCYVQTKVDEIQGLGQIKVQKLGWMRSETRDLGLIRKEIVSLGQTRMQIQGLGDEG